MMSSKMFFAVIAACVLPVAACNDPGPEMPAPSPEGEETAEFAKASGLTQPSNLGGASNVAPDFSSRTQAVMDNIKGQTQTVQGAVEALKLANELVAELQKLLAELQAEAPKQGEGESDEEFQARLAAYQQKVEAAQKNLQNAQQAVQKAMAEADAAQKELQKMQNSDLPKAQRDDAKAMEEYFENEKKRLEAELEQAASSLEEAEPDTDRGDESANRTETKKAIEKPVSPSPLKATTSSNTGQQEASNPLLSGGNPPSGSGLPTD
jgi:hypothetical protein